MNIKAKRITIWAALAMIFVSLFSFMPNIANAIAEFSVSPMKQKIILEPGEKFSGSFEVINPSSNTEDFHYELDVRPFYISEKDSTVVFENNGNYNQIVDWITLETDTGVVSPNSTAKIYFTIDTPSNAPAGGQYASIVVTENADAKGREDSVNIRNVLAIAHTIYAEVAGDTVRNGDIKDVNIPGFLTSDKISASSTIRNKGNVHGTAKYTLQVFPLFSDEEVYTNEEKPEEKIIVPERELYSIIYWDDTPGIGIFRVKYTVDFDGTNFAESSKIVIKCPIWLMILILVIVIAIIIWIIVAVKKHSKKSTKTED